MVFELLGSVWTLLSWLLRAAFSGAPLTEQDGASWECGRACLLCLTGFGVSWVPSSLVFLCLMSVLGGRGLSVLRKLPLVSSVLH